MANVKGKDNYDEMPQIVGNDIVPPGGTVGQVLTKDSSSDWDYSWQNGTNPASYAELRDNANSSFPIYAASWTVFGVAENSESAGYLTADAANDRIVVSSTAPANGRYIVGATILLDRVTTAADVMVGAFVNGVSLDYLKAGVAAGIAAENGVYTSASFSGIVTLQPNDILDFRLKSSVDTVVVTGNGTRMWVMKIAGDGAQGTQGIQGIPGADGDITWEGAWNSGTTYSANMAVEYNGSSYVAIATNLNDAPPSANWELMAAKGDTGPTGTANITVKDEGSNVVNTPHTALNFVGDGVVVTDGGSGVANVAISGAPGSTVQTISTSIGTGTTSIEHAMNIAPTIATGVQIATITITPTSASNKIRIQWKVYGDVSADRAPMLFLFRGSTFIDFDTINGFKRGYFGSTSGMRVDSPNTTSAVTYTLRAAISPSGTMAWGQNIGGDTLGGTLASKQFLIATEIQS